MILLEGNDSSERQLTLLLMNDMLAKHLLTKKFQSLKDLDEKIFYTNKFY